MKANRKTMDAAYLKALFEKLADEELLERASSGGLTEFAQAIADAEIAHRGLARPKAPSSDAETPEAEYLGDLVVVERHLKWTEAHILGSYLNSLGIPAIASDVNLEQNYSYMSVAFGGASVKVPSSKVEEAKEVIAAYRRGEFGLPESFDPGDAAP